MSRPRLLDLPGVLIDEADLPLTAGRGWYVTPNGYVGAMVTVLGKRKLLLLHRLLMGEPKLIVDHINGNKLDNRRANLRIASQTLNQANRKRLNRNNTSGVRGVAYHPELSPDRPWRAQITAARRAYHLGMFATKEEAIAARRAAEVVLWGENAP